MNNKYKILRLENALTDAGLVVRELKKNGIGVEHFIVNNEADYIRALDLFVPDIILFNSTLPSFNYLQSLKILRDKNLSIPFILITATPGDVAGNLVSAGVDDYVLKDDLRRLPYAIRHQNNIFGLYQRFHSNTDGVGLGLFMVKSQITALGGKIEVDSEEGKGTTFYITLKK